MWRERPFLDGASKDPSVRVIQNGLENRLDAKSKVTALRAIPKPHDLNILVGGTPALEQDSVATISQKLPQMILIAVSMTTILMFLAFGSLVLPIKAALMNALTLCSTLGVLTWIFIDGHLSGLLNFTPTPLTAPVIGLIIAVIFGLSTDYEVFLVSRMVEARARGMTTEEAIRTGTASTGRLISAAALVLVVVGGAFAFSDLVMMQYLAIGLITALLLDATVVRMFLVPAVMKLLGNDCWWAPQWMKRVQERIGLGEITLEDERKIEEPAPEQLDDALAFGTVLGAPAWQKPVHDPSRPTAAALAPLGAATGVALAERPPGGGDGDGDGDAVGGDDAVGDSAEPAENVDESAEEDIPAPAEETAGDSKAEADEAVPSEQVGDDEETAADAGPSDSDNAADDEHPASEDQASPAPVEAAGRSEKPDEVADNDD
jgi:RND superfamily putative drug exporter